jgi:hypothetical protein
LLGGLRPAASPLTAAAGPCACAHALLQVFYGGDAAKAASEEGKVVSKALDAVAEPAGWAVDGAPSVAM